MARHIKFKQVIIQTIREAERGATRIAHTNLNVSCQTAAFVRMRPRYQREVRLTCFATSPSANAPFASH